MKTRIIQDDPISAQPVPHEPPARPGPEGQGLSSLMKRHPLEAFFVLAYGLSWWAVPAGEFMPFGPLFAALIVIAIVEGRPGLRDLGSRMIAWRVNWRWYAVAIALPLAAVFAAFAANAAFGAPSSALDNVEPWHALILVFALRMINPLDGPMGEEPGWRGFALPRLQDSRSPLRATLILGLLVAGWHLPLVFLPAESLAPVHLPTTVAVTFIYTWIFNHTGGSVFMTLVAHAAQGTVVLSAFDFAGSDESRLDLISAALWCLVAIGLVVTDWSSWRGRAPSECRVAPRRVAASRSSDHQLRKEQR